MTKNSVQIRHGNDARHQILKGINELARVVGCTLGAKGQTVIIERGDAHHVTKDGVTVARSIYLADPLANLGVQLIKTASEKTGNFIGDGTTATAVLADSLCTEAYRLITEEKANPVELKKNLESELAFFLERLKSYVNTIDGSEGSKEKVRQIAMISSNYDKEVSDILTDAFETVTKDGIIMVDRGMMTSEKTEGMELQLIEGYRFERGYLHPVFMTDIRRGVCEYNNCKILLLHMEVNNSTFLQKVLTEVMNDNQAILIIVDDATGEMANRMCFIKQQGACQVTLVRSPSEGEERYQMMEDIAVLTGAELITKSDNRLRMDIESHLLGEAAKVVVTRTSTTIFGGKGNPAKIAERITSIQTDIDSGTLTGYQENYYKQRINKMRGKVAMIKVLSHTDSDLGEKLDRVDDAIHSIKSALSWGYCPGGGSSLNAIANQMEEEGVAKGLLSHALKAPMQKIIFNTSGTMPNEYLSNVKTLNAEGNGLYGFNALTEQVENMLDSNIIDPYEVIRFSVINACSVASLFITCDAAVITSKKEAQEALRDLLLSNLPE